MRGPLNPHTLQQIRSFLDLIERTHDPDAECKLWIDQDYVSIECNSKNLPINDVRVIAGAAPLEADEVADMERRRAIARKRALNDHW